MKQWPWDNPAIVDKTPIITTFLLESANVGQIWRMWTERTAAGQSLSAWIFVNIALILWWNFYRVVTPLARWARIGTAVGIAINFVVIFSVVWFRYVAV